MTMELPQQCGLGFYKKSLIISVLISSEYQIAKQSECIGRRAWARL